MWTQSLADHFDGDLRHPCRENSLVQVLDHFRPVPHFVGTDDRERQADQTVLLEDAEVLMLDRFGHRQQCGQNRQMRVEGGRQSLEQVVRQV